MRESALKVDSGEKKLAAPETRTRVRNAPCIRTFAELLLSFSPPVVPDVLSQFSIHVHIVISRYTCLSTTFALT